MDTEDEIPLGERKERVKGVEITIYRDTEGRDLVSGRQAYLFLDCSPTIGAKYIRAWTASGQLTRYHIRGKTLWIDVSDLPPLKLAIHRAEPLPLPTTPTPPGKEDLSP